MRLAQLAEVSLAEWDALASRRIFFGHQSVGRNIMEGVREIVADNPRIGLRVVQADDPAAVEGAALIEGRVGANRDPASKTARFLEIARSMGPGDIALHKYCYVDVKRGTDVGQLFEQYAESMQWLARSNRHLTVVHVTLPLTAPRAGLGEIARAALGKTTEAALNIARSRFNDCMRTAYVGREPLFDLARLESLGADGSRSSTRYGFQRIDQLAPEWTYDNGHLNQAGRRYIAEQLLIMLARLPVAPSRGAPVPADAPSASAQLN